MAGESCAPQVTDGNVGLAFGLVTAAGLSTAVGASLAFVMPYSTGGKNLFLAGSLGIAAGVMIYVSFVEIFTAKAIPALEECISGKQYAYLYGTLCFFAGVFLTWLFDQGLHFLERKFGKTGKKHASARQGDGPPIALDALRNVVESVATSDGGNGNDADSRRRSAVHNAQQQTQLATRPGLAIGGGTVTNSDHSVEVARTVDTENSVSSDLERNAPAAAVVDEPIDIDHGIGKDGHMVADIYREHGHDARALTRMGMFAGIALA